MASHTITQGTNSYSPGRDERTQQILFWLLAWALVGVLIFFSAEGLARWLNLAPPVESQYASYVADPKVGYRHQPLLHIQGKAGSGEYDYDYTHNSQGLRDVEHSFIKPKGQFRIIGLGDSFAYGAGASFDDSYLRRFEVTLQKEFGPSKVDIVKAGISRSFPEMERRYLESYGLAYEPDLVVLAFTPNDIVDTYMAGDTVQVTSDHRLRVGDQLMGRFGEYLYTASHFWRWLRFFIYQRQQILSWQSLTFDSPVNAKAWAKIHDEFLLMKSLAEQHGARLVILFIPQGNFFNRNTAFIEDRLALWGQQNNVSVVRTLKEFERAHQNHETTHWPKDGHCTPRGYEILSQRLKDELTSSIREFFQQSETKNVRHSGVF